MTDPDCAGKYLLIQADLDGELDVGDAARLAAHVAGCAQCQVIQSELARLSARLRAELPAHPAPERLRRLLTAPAPAPPARFGGGRRSVAAFGVGAALAAGIALFLAPAAPGLDDEIVAGHIRALQPGHLMDVPSTDQHTVKPWFDGRLDYAPPVKNLAAAGFPLLGGRLDYLDRRPVAALVYGRDKHVIDLFVWPDAAGRAPRATTRDGYNVVSWAEGGMAMRAVSDLEAGELAEFARLWTKTP